MLNSGRHLLYLILVAINIYQGESCLTIPQSLDMSSVSCDNTSDGINCTVTCNQGLMFDDGSTSRVYQCQDGNTFKTPLYKSSCLRQLLPVFRIILFVDYSLTHLGKNCIEGHREAILFNLEFFREQITSICDWKGHLKGGNLSFHNITSKSSSFDILTTYVISLDNSLLSQDMVKSCAQQILSNTKSGAILMYATSILCSTGAENITIRSSMVNISTTFCPALYHPTEDKNDRTYCDYVLPLVGVTHYVYASYYSSNVDLFCEATFGNSQNNSVYWKHNDREIKITSRFNGSTVAHPSLIIHNVSYTDSGEYICNAINEFGKSSSIPISLTVLKDDNADKNESTVQIAGISSTMTYLQSTKSMRDSVLSSKPMTELSNKINCSVQKLSSAGTDTNIGKTVIGVSVVAVLGWTIVVILAVNLLYKRKHCCRHLMNSETHTMKYDDLNVVSDNTRYSSIKMKTVPSDQYEYVANHAK